jgi:5-exo-hydroxycamphor dehydrogenase
MQYNKVAIFTRPGEPVKIVEEEIQTRAPDEILVRVALAGVCGSDVHRLKGDIPFGSKAVCFGHEAVGVIESLGKESRQTMLANRSPKETCSIGCH